MRSAARPNTAPKTAALMPLMGSVSQNGIWRFTASAPQA